MHTQILEHVHLDLGVGRGCQCYHRHAGMLLLHIAQQLAVEPKVVAPLSDAVSLIDDEPGQLLPLIQMAQQLLESWALRHHLRRHIEQLCPQVFAEQLAKGESALDHR